MSAPFSLAFDLLVLLCGLLHVFFFYLESLIFYRGGGKALGAKKEDLPTQAVMAANQGFYNLVLTAGCVFALVRGEDALKVFFVSAIAACGIVGAITCSSVAILRAQFLPAVFALLLWGVKNNVEKGQQDLATLSYVAVALASTTALSLFLKNRLKNDKEVYLKKIGK